MITLIVHVDGSEPVKLDVEDMPEPDDQVIVGKNPRDRADKEVTWVDDGVSTVIIPWHRINYVQVVPDPSEEADVIDLYRD